MSTYQADSPDTIVLIHGLWMSPLSWEKWIERYGAHGYRVIAPGWPGMDGDIDQFRADPSAVDRLGMEEIIDHYETIIRDLDTPPIIMGHSFGGAFANTMTEEAARQAYDRYAVPGPGRVLFQAAFANLNPHAATKADFRKDRAPLLLIAGEHDHTVPAVVDRSVAKHYEESPALTEYKEFPDRSHFIIGQDGWQEVADYALRWAVDHAAIPVPTA